MDLAKQAKIVDSIHDTLHDFVGQRLKVRANMGRSKIVENEGVLTQVHPQLFIMEVDRKRGRTARQSYQYVDVLTGMVELSQNGEPLFEPFIPDAEGVLVDEESSAPDEEKVVSGRRTPRHPFFGSLLVFPSFPFALRVASTDCPFSRLP